MDDLKNENNNILTNKKIDAKGFSDNELNLLNDLITFNRRYEEAFFNNKIDNDILEMIDNIIDEKVQSISPDLAFKFLNRIWTLSSEEETTLNNKILNNLECDLAINRLSILLLDRATENGEIFFNNYDTKSEGLENYLNLNFYNRICDIGPKANKMLMLDHVELFLALLNESTEINQDLINKITDIYLFLYKDIYNEVLKNNLTKNSAVILSQRFNGYEKYIMNYHTDIKEETIAVQFIFESLEMLQIKDDNISEDDIERLKIGKIYLDSLLMLLKEFEFDKVLSYYQEEENDIDLRECTKSLSYVKKSIEEKDKKIKKK